jgi:Fe-Mn family superoxide dismutase
VFILPKLPYAYDALQPTLSADTLHHHHDKHHAKYVETLNKLLEETPNLASATLEDIIAEARGGQQGQLFNNAGQAWNHGFFWEAMAPDGGRPEGALAKAIEQDFGGLDGLKTALVGEGAGHFASGWAWLVLADGALKVIATHDADTVADREDLVPLLVVDVWEHAYYLDYQQDRQGFLQAWFDRLINWRFVAEQYEAAKVGRGGYRYPPPMQKAA